MAVFTASCSSNTANDEDLNQPSESLADRFDPSRNSATESPSSSPSQSGVSSGDTVDDDAIFADVPDTPLCQLVVTFKKNNSFINQMTTELVTAGRGNTGLTEERFINTKPELLQAAQSALESVHEMKELVPSDVAAALVSQQVLAQNALDSLLEAESFTDFATNTSNFARPMLADLIESGFIYNPYIKDECQVTLT